MYIVLLLFTVFSVVSCSYIFDIQHRYTEGEGVALLVRDLGSSVQTHIHHSFKRLPNCLPSETLVNSSRSLRIHHAIGAVLIGTSTHEFPISLPFMKNITCHSLCAPIQVTHEMLEFMTRMIQYQYYAQYIVGVLPAVRSDVISDSGKWLKRPEFGATLGEIVAGEMPVYNNHIHFDVMYSKRRRIVYVTGTPSSRTSCHVEATPETAVRLGPDTIVTPSLSVHWHEAPDGYDTNLSFDHYIGGYVSDVEVSLFYIIPPIVLLLFSLHMFYSNVYVPVYITHRAVRARVIISSASKFRNAIPIADIRDIFGIDRVVESNWKQLREHILKRPLNATLLIILVAFGVHAVVLIFMFMFIAATGSYVGYMAENFVNVIAMTFAVWSPMFLSLISGYMLQWVEQHTGRFATMAGPRVSSELTPLVPHKPTTPSRPSGSNENEVEGEEILLMPPSLSSSHADHINRPSDSNSYPEVEELDDEEYILQDRAGVRAVIKHGSLHICIHSCLKMLYSSNIKVFSSVFTVHTCGMFAVLAFLYWLQYDDIQDTETTTLVNMSVFWFVVGIIMNLMGLLIGRLHIPKSGFKPTRVSAATSMQYPKLRFMIMRCILIVCISGASLVPAFYGIYSSFWNSRIDYAFSFILFNIVFTLIAVALIVNTFVFQMLCRLDYRWQWASFHLGGSVGYIIVVFAFVYLLRSPIAGTDALIVYWCWSGIFAIMAYLMFGGVSYIVSYHILMKIYSGLHYE